MRWPPHFLTILFKMSIKQYQKREIADLSPVIKCAVAFGTPEALYLHRDCLKGNKNRHRIIKKAVEQHLAIAQCNIVDYALKYNNKRKALKIYPDFYPGDPHRDRKLTKAIQTHQLLNKTQIQVHCFPLASADESTKSSYPSIPYIPSAANSTFVVDTTWKANGGGGINLFPAEDEPSGFATVETFVPCRDIPKPSSLVKHPPRLKPVLYHVCDLLPDFPIEWRICEGQSCPRLFSQPSDIRKKHSWQFWLFLYNERIAGYNAHVSGGLPERREVIHAYHFPHEGQREAFASAPDCVAGMPTNRDGVAKWYLSKSRISLLFDRLVNATGFNAAMVLTPKSPLSMLNAFACSYYAAVPIGTAKSEEELLKSCVDWLLSGNCVNAWASTSSLTTSQLGSDVQSSSRRLLDVWCEIMSVPVETHVVEKKVRMCKHLKEISFKLGAVYKTHFPMLNELFLMVLCELYRCTVTILDNALGRVSTYEVKTNSLFIKRHQLILFKVDDKEYFGVFDLNVL
jgi:hypothetical protein